MTFSLNTQESIPDLKIRVAKASTEELEEAVELHSGKSGPTRNHVSHIKNELRRRRGKVEFRLSWETRFIAYAALGMTAVQLYLQICPPS